MRFALRQIASASCLIHGFSMFSQFLRSRCFCPAHDAFILLRRSRTMATSHLPFQTHTALLQCLSRLYQASLQQATICCPALQSLSAKTLALAHGRHARMQAPRHLQPWSTSSKLSAQSLRLVPHHRSLHCLSQSAAISCLFCWTLSASRASPHHPCRCLHSQIVCCSMLQSPAPCMNLCHRAPAHQSKSS